MGYAKRLGGTSRKAFVPRLRGKSTTTQANHQAKGEVMASVKRYNLKECAYYTNDFDRCNAEMVEEDDGYYVLASDYDRLVAVVRGFLACNYSCTCMRDNQCDFCLMRSKALALLGEGGEESK